MMPNKTYELRNLYFQQSQYSAEQAKPDYPLFLQWPDKGYFEKFKPDADLLQKALSPLEKSITNSIADQVFGNLKQIEYLFTSSTSRRLTEAILKSRKTYLGLRLIISLIRQGVFQIWKASYCSLKAREETRNLHSGKIPLN
jgi:hypothetical protein